MASITDEPPESFYLPSLDKCLNGDHRLISWKQAHEALSNLEIAKRSPNLRSFLQDEQSINALSADLDTLPKPTPQSKSDFESKTAAVNVTPSQDGHFDIEQLKDDTQWLSKQAELDEVSALRIAILEWQARPARRVLDGYTEEELLAVQEVVGDTGFGSSLLGSALGANGTEVSRGRTFDSNEARRTRLLQILLSECECLLEVSYLLRAATLPYGPSRLSDLEKGPMRTTVDQLPWLDGILEKLGVAASSKQKSSNSEIRLEAATKELESALEGWEASIKLSASLDDPFTVEASYRTSQLRRVLSILKLSSVHLAGLPNWTSARNGHSWFAFVAKFAFLELLQPQLPDQESLIGPIQALVSFISLQIFRLPEAITHIHEAVPSGRPIPYIYDQSCREQVELALTRAADSNCRIASPAILAWSIILQNLRERCQSAVVELGSDDEITSPNATPETPRARSLSSNVPSGFTATLDDVGKEHKLTESIEFYARIAIDSCGVLSVTSLLSRLLRSVLAVPWNMSVAVNASLVILQLARETLKFTSYSAEIVETMLVLLEDDEEGEPIFGSGTSPVHAAVAETVTKDHEILVPRLLYLAQQRYPYELGPFLKLFKALATPEDPNVPDSEKILPLAEPTNQFTQQLPANFNGYELVREDENTNGVRLTEELRLFFPRRKTSGLLDEVRALSSESATHPLLAHIPAGTSGTVVSESKPFIVSWDYRHSAIQYLAALLSSMTPSSAHRDAVAYEELDTEIQADIIGLLAKLIEAYKDGSKGRYSSVQASAPAMWVLEEASDGLGRNQDIISVVSEIFEEQLSYTRVENTELLVSCIDFFTAVLSVVPGRIWSVLARGELLNVKGALARGGRLVAIVSSIDAGKARSATIASTLSLFDALIESSLVSAVSHKKPSGTVAKRFVTDESRIARLPKGVSSNILQALTQATLSIFEGMQRGNADLLNCSRCLRIFDRVVMSVYGCGDAVNTSEGPAAALVSSARLLARVFLGPDDSTPLRRLLSASAMEASTTPECFESLDVSRYPLTPSLQFLVNLLDISVRYPDQQGSHLLKGLFQSLPVYVRLYIASDTYQRAISKLLTNLIRKAGTLEQEPPSLLGHLGPDVAKAFMGMLRHLGRPLANTDVEVKAWDFAAAVVSNKQQWFAAFLINGESPKRSPKDKQPEQQAARRRKPLLRIALDELAAMKLFDDERSLSMLRFVVQVQNHWPAISTTLHEHERFIDSLLDYMGDLRENMSPRGGLEQANQVYAAALIADVLAMYVNNMRQCGVTIDVEDISSKLTFYRENGLLAPTYNQSLHTNLKRNFESLFSGCTLDSFKHALGSPSFGRNYYYDHAFAGEVLGEHQAWNSTRGGGLAEEFARANLNLSVVEAEILLTKSWASLLTELSSDLQGHEVLQKQIVGVVLQCLEQEADSSLHEAIFESLQQRRIDLALVLLQRLVNVRCKASSIKTLLPRAWEAVRRSEQDFETAFSGGDTPYYRSALQVLMLALQPWTYLATPLPSGSSANQRELPFDTISILLEIVGEVVCKGFRSLCTQLHSNPSTVDPSDFALLLGLVQIILRIPGITTAYTQLTLRTSDTGVHHYALALFSWSDRLVTNGMSSSNRPGQINDPLIYADISASFLRELSHIPPYAEYLATEGILIQLSTAPLLSHLRSPTTSNAPTRTLAPQSLHHARLVTIYARAILPLTLNLLSSVGSSFAPEAVAFLASFPAQFARASAALRTNGPPARSRDAAVPHEGITLTAVAEVHTLCLIDVAVAQALESPSGIAGLVEPLPGAWDRAGVKEEVEAWLGGRRAELRERIVPGNEWEEGLLRGQAARGAEEGCENGLEQVIVGELRGALLALGGE